MLFFFACDGAPREKGRRTGSLGSCEISCENMYLGMPVSRRRSTGDLEKSCENS